MTTLDDFLTDHLAPPVELDTDEERKNFTVDGARTAGWALRRLARARAEVDRINAEADARIALVEQWRADTLAAPTRDAEWAESLVVDWHAANVQAAYADALDAYLAANPSASTEEAADHVWGRLKNKTLKLPDGTVTARRTPEGVEVLDADAVVTWALEAGQRHLVRTAPATSELRRLPRAGDQVVSADGEVVPGVRTRPGRVVYAAKVDTTLERPAWEPPPGVPAL